MVFDARGDTILIGDGPEAAWGVWIVTALISIPTGLPVVAGLVHEVGAAVMLSAIDATAIGVAVVATRR